MALIEWKEEYRIGIPAVDHEHQDLIALLNDLYASLGGEIDRATTSEFLGEVYAQVSAHFALEERIMRERGYRHLDAHKADHEDLLDEIREIMDESESTDLDGLGRALGQRLETWFGTHFRTHDARLHRELGPEGQEHGEN